MSKSLLIKKKPNNNIIADITKAFNSLSKKDKLCESRVEI